MIRCTDPEILAAAAEKAPRGGVLAPATAAGKDRLAEAAKKFGHALAVAGETLDEIAGLTAEFKEAGCPNLLLHHPARNLAEQFQLNTIARRAALQDSFKPLGYPALRFIEPSADPFEVAGRAITEIDKYGGICVLPYLDPALLAPLITLRLNIYTDPQKPIQVDPRIYPIGEPTRRSPVFITTNFSLTYFIVSGEIENSGISAWLLVPECEGMSVLTAWAAGKFSGGIIGKQAKEFGLEGMVDDRRLIIPGYVAQISGELEEALPGWQVLVGPQEASDIESFVKSRLT